MSKVVSVSKLHSTLEKMAEHFSAWDRDYQFQLQECKDTHRIIFLNMRINMLKHALEDAGFNFDRTEMINEASNCDSLEWLELQDLAQEFVWKVNDIEHELKRRWPSLDQPTGDTGDECIRNWIRRAQKIVVF